MILHKAFQLFLFHRASWVALVVKNLPANAGDIRDTDSIPGFGRSPRGGHGNPLQYSCLENPMNRGAWQATVHGGHKQTLLLLQLLSRFSRVRLCATPKTAAHQAPRPWDSPGKNTGVGCHFLLQRVKVKSESEVAQSYPTLSDPMDCSLPGSSMGFSRQGYWSGVPLPSQRDADHPTMHKTAPTTENYVSKVENPCSMVLFR